MSLPRRPQRRCEVEESVSTSDVEQRVASPASPPRGRSTVGAKRPLQEWAGLLTGVVKVFSTMVKPHYSMPWQMCHEEKSTASGFVIEGRRILTNAHAVAYYSSVRVRKYGDARKATAHVVAMGHDCDLALLEVHDSWFWEGLEGAELPFGDLPELQADVTVVGFPLGGDNISVTSGVISRMDYLDYVHGSEKLLAIQIDAAINAGNSGGPAFHAERVVGVAFQALDEGENIGYIIPLEVVRHFLREVDRSGRFSGFGRLGVHWQTMENEHLRRYAQMQPEKSGVLLTRVLPVHPASGILRNGDVLLAVDGALVADDGTIAFRGRERINFAYSFSLHSSEDTVRLRILRGGEEAELDVPLGPVPRLVPSKLFDAKPSYVVHAGLVFTVLSEPFLEAEWGKVRVARTRTEGKNVRHECGFGFLLLIPSQGWDMRAPIKLVHAALARFKEQPGEEVVVLSQVLAHPVTAGYDSQAFANMQVLKVGKQPLLNLRALVTYLYREAFHSEFIEIELSDNHTIVLPTHASHDATQDICERHSIPLAVSEDMVDIVRGSAGAVPVPPCKRPRLDGDEEGNGSRGKRPREGLAVPPDT